MKDALYSLGRASALVLIGMAVYIPVILISGDALLALLSAVFVIAVLSGLRRFGGP